MLLFIVVVARTTRAIIVRVRLVFVGHLLVDNIVSISTRARLQEHRHSFLLLVYIVHMSLSCDYLEYYRSSWYQRPYCFSTFGTCRCNQDFVFFRQSGLGQWELNDVILVISDQNLMFYLNCRVYLGIYAILLLIPHVKSQDCQVNNHVQIIQIIPCPSLPFISLHYAILEPHQQLCHKGRSFQKVQVWWSTTQHHWSY